MKPKLINGNVITEYDTEAELFAAVALISPTDQTYIDRLREADKAAAIGRELVKDLYQTLKQQNLTQVQEGDLINRIISTLLAISMGFIRGAREICNNTPTGGSFTAGRKTFLLNAIDAAIAQL